MSAIEIVGLLNPSNGRSCERHPICGVHFAALHTVVVFREKTVTGKTYWWRWRRHEFRLLGWWRWRWGRRWGHGLGWCRCASYVNDKWGIVCMQAAYRLPLGASRYASAFQNADTLQSAVCMRVCPYTSVATPDHSTVTPKLKPSGL